jgi:prophage maintenance system killer protein
MARLHALRDKNRRTGILLLIVFLGLTAVAVAFVILRKLGYA